jgi:catechol 2,3-dioxygenase-like lactoylglutathione lyase family enzyme
MKRIHINLQVLDLDRAVSFYSRLFAARPTKLRDDYAKWALDDPRLNFSVSQTDGRARLEHLGIEAETREELAELRGRIARIEDLRDDAVREEGETTCCYANSDKTWVTDPVDLAWEIFHTHGESDTNRAAGDACCDEDTCCTSA